MTPKRSVPPAPDLPPDLAARAAEVGAEADAARRPNAELIGDFGKAGLLRLVVPESYGGRGLEPVAFMSFIESIAQIHPSTAWTVMTTNEEAGIASAYLSPEYLTGLFADRPEVVIAGSGVPKGRARRVGGGWMVSGRWDFVSGCTAAQELVLASLVIGDDGELVRPHQMCFVLVPADAATIEDTWHTAGMSGTGSHDVVVDELFVTEERAGACPLGGLPVPDDPFYRLPSGLRFPFPKVGVALGAARAAVVAFDELAGAKKPLHARSTLSSRPTAAAARARAEALIASSRAWVVDVAEELMESAGERRVTPELHARCRLACSHAVGAGIEAVSRLADEAGSTANFLSSPMPRLAADVRAVAGHFMVAPYQMATAGRVLLGLDPDDPQF